jgi:hypothetical protein
MSEDAAKTYQKALAYLAAAKRLLVIARRLDDEDKEATRRLADGFVGKGTALLSDMVGTRRRAGTTNTAG